MLARRVAMALLAGLAAVPAGWAQEHPLVETVKVGECFRYQIDMKLDGELRIHKGDKVVPIKLTATASHAFSERALAVDAGLVEKAARLYEAAKVNISAGEEKSERTLRPERRLIVAQRPKDQYLVYCPAGPLTRAELDLTGDHFDTLCLAGLLPGKGVKVGDTWNLPPAVAQALCHFEGLAEQKLAGKLEKVEGDVASFSVTGTASGIEQGALIKLTVEASGKFDLKGKRLTSLVWKQKDDRDQGPVSPATRSEMTISVTRQNIPEPPGLADVALVSVPDGFSPPASMTQIEHREAKGSFALIHGREWQLVAESAEHTILRLMDKGDFVAQVTVTPWKPAKPGGHLSEEEFKEAMYNTSGWRPEKELQAGVVPTADEKRWVYRLSAQGVLEGVEVLQNFYLVAAPGGEQVVLTFTLNPKQADKLGARDLSLATSIEVPAKK